MAKKPLVIVYAPDGTPKKTSRRNARDLVAHAGYGWRPGERVASPAAHVPYAATKAPPGELAQEVIDRAGNDPNRTIESIIDDDGDEVIDMAAGEVEIVEDFGADASAPAAEAAEEAEAPKRRGGRRKAAED